MQAKLSDLQQWFDMRQLKISYKKCYVLHVLPVGNQRTKPRDNLVLGDNVLTQVDNVRDLGVIVDI